MSVRSRACVQHEGTHCEYVISQGGVDGDAAVQEQETADQRKTVGGGRVLLQTLKLMEIPGNRAAVHLQQVNTGHHICHHGDQVYQLCKVFLSQ